MIKRKIYIKDMHVNEEKPKGCFTDDSYIVVAIPSYKEKSRFVKESQKIDRADDIANFELLENFVTETCCYSTDDSSEKIKDFDNLLAFADGKIVLDWLTDLIMHGFVPKKS